MNLVAHKKKIIQEQEFKGEVLSQDLTWTEFSRVFAVEVIFKDVNFKQSEFIRCYFRNCRFIRCNFIGASIKESNFRGSQFEGCKFEYSVWEKTYLEENFLDTSLPNGENLARDLTRSLRVNFSQIGNYEAVNKAAAIEVNLTGQHLYNAAYSRQAYYRSLLKYKGWSRVSYAIKHARWKALDLLWGNGESIVRVAITGFTVIVLVAFSLMHVNNQLHFSDAFLLAFYSFWGVQNEPAISDLYSLVLIICRFILFGLFMAILVKRLSRR